MIFGVQQSKKRRIPGRPYQQRCENLIAHRQIGVQETAALGTQASGIWPQVSGLGPLQPSSLRVHIPKIRRSTTRRFQYCFFSLFPSGWKSRFRSDYQSEAASGAILCNHSEAASGGILCNHSEEGEIRVSLTWSAAESNSSSLKCPRLYLVPSVGGDVVHLNCTARPGGSGVSECVQCVVNHSNLHPRRVGSFATPTTSSPRLYHLTLRRG